MIFLANENFPFPSINLLRSKGLEVISVAEKFSGASDKTVIEIAEKENLIILTFDKDYGELIFKYKSKRPPAVIFFRHKGKMPNFAGDVLIRLIDSKKIHFEKIFTVIENENVRQRRYLEG